LAGAREFAWIGDASVMDNRDQARRETRYDGFRLIAALIAVMWISEGVDVVANHELDRLGIEPREPDGLIGILAAPFLHAGFGHLLANTVPFAVMGVVIALNGARRVLIVTAIVALVSGLGTWLVGPQDTLHIGASGIVFGYATYLLARGFFNRNVLELAIGAVIAVVWGGVLLGGVLPEQGISWQSHVFGALGGLLAAQHIARARGGRTSPAGA